MNRVEITRPIGDPQAGLYALCYMQVCAVPDATDEEILVVCNRDNPAGTQNGWSSVIRQPQKPWVGPVACESHSDRQHLLVIC